MTANVDTKLQSVIAEHFGGKAENMLAVALRVNTHQAVAQAITTSRWVDKSTYEVDFLGVTYRVFLNEHGCWDWLSEGEEYSYYADGTRYTVPSKERGRNTNASRTLDETQRYVEFRIGKVIREIADGKITAQPEGKVSLQQQNAALLARIAELEAAMPQKKSA